MGNCYTCCHPEGRVLCGPKDLWNCRQVARVLRVAQDDKRDGTTWQAAQGALQSIRGAVQSGTCRQRSLESGTRTQPCSKRPDRIRSSTETCEPPQIPPVYCHPRRDDY